MPLQGFGRLWQKAYQIELHAVVITPAEAITLWKRSRSSGCSSTGERGRDRTAGHDLLREA
jgi:hypothetical protein